MIGGDCAPLPATGSRFEQAFFAGCGMSGVRGRRARVRTVGSRLLTVPNLEVVAHARHERILSSA